MNNRHREGTYISKEKRKKRKSTNASDKTNFRLQDND
jgi:hypothetical protein